MNNHRLKIQLLCVCSLIFSSAAHASSDLYEKKLDTILKNSRLNRVLQFTTLGLALYILNDKDPNNIATDVKKTVRDCATDATHAIHTAVSDGINSIRVFVEESMPRKKENGSPEAVTESKKTDSESDSN